jgi:lysine 6-dehydrogenase
MRMLVLGAGLQGAACAFDLLNTAGIDEVRLGDLRVDQLPSFLAPFAGGRLRTLTLDVQDREAVLRAMRGCAAVMSAVPYYLNAPLAALAIEAGAHFCDLGGNTDIVQEQRRLDAEARRRGVAVVADCGLAPGLVNIVAQYGIAQLDRVEAVRLYVGGLPQRPEPPLNYQVVYSLEGVLDYYTTRSWVLRDGVRTSVTALSEVEEVQFPAPVGRLEAFHTAGGLSTMAFRYEGVVPVMEYKTLRYPGHARILEAMRQMGFFDTEPVEVKGQPVVPRDVAIAVMGPRLRRPAAPDFVAVRVVVRGAKAGTPRTLIWELVDRMDEARGITAMMRTTGFSLAVTAVMQARGDILPGVHTPDECVPAVAYMRELSARGIDIRQVAS